MHRMFVAVMLGGLVPVSAAFCPSACPSAVAAERFVFHHDNVLGTSAELQVQADSADAARAAERVALEEIDRLAKILSGYDATSEFSRWQAAWSRSVRASDELLDVLEACNRWRTASGGAFNPAVETISRLWSRCAGQGRMPTAEELAQAAAKAQQAAWQVDRTKRTAWATTDCPLTLNALAKGYIVDRACRAAMDPQRGVRGVLLNVGGDMRLCGEIVARIGIADPWHDSLTTRPLARIELRNKAMATSGNYQRGFTVRGRRFSHIVDPRSGWPTDRIVSASVVADRGEDADALATICCVLPVQESLGLVKRIPGAECMLVGEDGQIVRSEGWRRIELPPLDVLALAEGAPSPSAESGDRRETAKADWSRQFELEVAFEINSPEGVRRYARPYVAVWIEDKNGIAVRTLVLWVWKSGPGPRWIPDLRRWYRSDQLRRLAEDTDLVDTMSRATRPPGKYKAVWDGKDDRGNPVDAGEYTVLIEAAREHGTYQILTKKITLGAEPLSQELNGNVEIKSATIEYRRKK